MKQWNVLIEHRPSEDWDDYMRIETEDNFWHADLEKLEAAFQALNKMGLLLDD